MKVTLNLLDSLLIHIISFFNGTKMFVLHLKENRDDDLLHVMVIFIKRQAIMLKHIGIFIDDLQEQKIGD